MSDGEDAGAPTPAEPSSAAPPPGPPPALPPPPERGWPPVPGNPNYQRFWDGQNWGQQRYWGGGGAPDASAPAGTLGPSGLPGPDPFAMDRTPSFDAPVQHQRGFFGPPLNPRSPYRQAAVVAVGVILFFVYLSLHIFPGRLLVLFIVLGLVFFLVQLPARLRFLRDPARRDAIREPITFQSKVWLRFTYAPSRVPYFQVGRWDMAVRTDSFQVTNWIFGSRNRARSTYFNAAEAVMWQTVADGRDGIVVSGPTYNRSKVEFVFSAEEGNAEAWNALARAGVRSVPAPLTGAGGSLARGFGRIGPTSERRRCRRRPHRPARGATNPQPAPLAVGGSRRSGPASGARPSLWEPWSSSWWPHFSSPRSRGCLFGGSRPRHSSPRPNACTSRARRR